MMRIIPLLVIPLSGTNRERKKFIPPQVTLLSRIVIKLLHKYNEIASSPPITRESLAKTVGVSVSLLLTDIIASDACHCERSAAISSLSR
ncbi:hypothetical protein AMJ80_01020 [bacterium SM23_31]|nr:MAG: hypothetical protein AMJ80_01020 [bacterium SM23_31]